MSYLGARTYEKAGNGTVSPQREAPSSSRVLDQQLPRLLVIDDEPRLGRTLSIAFSGCYEVVSAKSARQALDILQHNSAFELVLCDLQLPDIPGVDVFEELSQRWPHLESRFVLTSGGNFGGAAEHFAEHRPEQCLPKPFMIEQLDDLLLRLATSRGR